MHTNLVRVRASTAPKYFLSGDALSVNLPISMWSGCRRADPVVLQAYPRMPRYVLAFLHLKAALHVILRNEGVAVYIDRLKNGH